MPFNSQDEESIQYRYTKSIDIDTIIWLKKRLYFLEGEEQYSARAVLFDEFHLETK